MRKWTAAQKREIRRLAGVAYDRELSALLSALEKQFARWRSGEIATLDLNEAIHQYHDHGARDLWKRYQTRIAPEFLVMQALDNGALSFEELSKDIRAAMMEALDSRPPIA
jgi:hypothetical protein